MLSRAVLKNNSGLVWLLMPSSLLMISTGHGDRDRMIKETRHKYANIAPSFWSCLSRCQECQKKSKRRMTESLQNSCQGTSSIWYIRTISRSPVFCDWPIKSKSCSTFRAPSESGLSQPTSSRKLETFWPALFMVHGKPRHLHILGFVNRANGGVKYCWWPGLHAQLGYRHHVCAVPEELLSFRYKALSIYSFIWRRGSCRTHNIFSATGNAQ